MLEIAGQQQVRAFETLAQARELLLDGVEVQQRLTGVLAGAVAAVDHRHSRGLGEFRHGALIGVAQDDGIDVTAHHAAGVVEGLALGHRREGEAGGVADTAAETRERRVKADAGPRTGFEEQVAEHRALEHAGHLAPLGEGLHAAGELHQVFDVIAGQGIDGKQVGTHR